MTAGSPTSGRGSLAGRAGEPRPLSPSRSFPRNRHFPSGVTEAGWITRLLGAS